MVKGFLKLFTNQTETLNNLFDELGKGVIEEGPDGKVISANKRVLDLLDLQEYGSCKSIRFINFQLQQLRLFSPQLELKTLQEDLKKNTTNRKTEITTVFGRKLYISQYKTSNENTFWIFEEQKSNDAQKEPAFDGVSLNSLIQAIDEIEDAYFSLEENGNIRFLSKAIDTIFGINGKDYLGKNFKTLPGIKFTLDGKVVSELSVTNTPNKITFSIANEKGCNHYALKLRTANLDNGGKIIIGSIYNINQEKETERLLKLSNDTLQIIDKTQSIYIQTHNAHAALSYLLEKIIQITNSEFGFIGEIIPDEAEGRLLKSRALSNIAWDDATRTLYQDTLEKGLVFRNNNTLFGQVVKSGETYIANHPKSNPNSAGVPKGHPPLHNFMGLPLYNGDHFWAMIGLANKPEGFTEQDIEILKPFGATIISIFIGDSLNQQTLLSNKKIEQKEQSMQAILNSLEDIILEMNEAQEIINIFRNNERDNEATLNKSFSACDFLNAENYLKFRTGVKQAFETNKKVNLVVKEYLPNSDQIKWLSIKINPINTENYKHVSTLFEDITALKKAEEELVQLLEKERELGLLKTNFLNMASHELKTPLSVIQSSAEISALLLPTQAEKVEKHLNQILDQTGRLNRIMNDVFTLGKLENGKTKVQFEPINISELLQRVIKNCSLQYPNAQVNLLEELKSPIVETDFTLLDLVLNNLVGNALKYNKENLPVSILCTDSSTHLQIEIKDQGIGISEKDQKKLFESFHRGSNVSSISGTGLGLYIVKKLTETIQGTIAFSSELGKGSSFVITLPKKAPSN